MGTTYTSIQRWPLLAAVGSLHSTDDHVRSLERRRPVNAALLRVPRLAPAASAALKWAARKAQLNLRVPAGGSCWRIRFSACASGPPGTSRATSQPASRDRSSFTAET
eukprot:3072250-Pleurochrysis_carterae.AAC.1